MYFIELEPWEEERQEYQFAQIASLLVNMFGRREGEAAKDLSEFLFTFVADALGERPSRKKDQTWQEQKEIGRMLYLLYSDRQ